MRGEHVNIEVANTMLGPSSYFHVRVFSLSFHTSMVTYVTDIASELLPCKSSGGGGQSIFWSGGPVSLFPQK